MVNNFERPGMIILNKKTYKALIIKHKKRSD